MKLCDCSNNEKNMLTPQKLPIYLKLCQLTKYLYERRRSFTKEHKYDLGAEMMSLAWECLDLFLEANRVTNAEKKVKIVALSHAFDRLKLRLRMCQELGLLTEKQFAHLNNQFIQEIGTMLGGWLKWSEGRIAQTQRIVTVLCLVPVVV